MEEEKLQDNKEAVQKRDSDRLGTEPVHPLLLKMSAPLAVSMFVMALYNIVDSIYHSIAWRRENRILSGT